MPAHPVAILQGVDINVNYTLIMLNCVVVGCSNVSGRDGKSFHRIPAVIRGQGARTLELSSERRDKWSQRAVMQKLIKIQWFCVNFVAQL
jgi:hypothetical protein